MWAALAAWRVRVFATENANTWKIARIEGLGAEVVRVGPDLAAARASAEAYAARHRAHLITDGTAPALSEGAATIGEEILRSGPQDTIVVPVGDGSLISGIGLWVRAHAPGTAIIGVNPTEGTMRDSVRIGRPATARSARRSRRASASRARTPSRCAGCGGWSMRSSSSATIGCSRR
jgi:threonine dehydratase